MAVQHTSDASFADDVLTNPTPTLVEFTAAWCPPCKMIAPVLERSATEQTGRMRVVALDVDENPETTRRYGVMGMPTMALFIDGQIATPVVGARPQAALMNALEPYLPVRAV
jgi:thioredoxin 1